jgi:PAS domain S-box-containing protein
MTAARLIIVEDEAVVALDLQGQLEEMGHQVCGIAQSGEQALAIARENHPDLALMDIRIRGAMDGVQVAEQMGRELHVPVIYLTAHSDADTVQRAARTAPYGYLTKPFQPQELRAGIEVALYKARMEQRLRESERWFASTLRCVQDGVIVTEANGIVRFLNPTAERLTGWAGASAVGQPVTRLLRYEDDEAASTAAERAIREGHVVGVHHARRLRTHDGRIERVDESAAPVNDERGRLLGAVVVLRDASERLLEEERLRASEDRFRSAFDHAPLGMAVVSLQGVILQANAALGRLLGDETHRFAGCALSALTHPDDLAHEQSRLHELVAVDAVAQFEKRHLRLQDKEPVWTMVSVSVLRDAAQQPMCYLYQIHDLTAQRKAAEQLAELAAERMKVQEAEMAARARNEFFARVSHELRTPLNAVVGFAELLKMKGVADSLTTQYANHILRAAQHLVALVDDVLEVQRAVMEQTSLELKSIDVADCLSMVQHMLSPLAAKYEVTSLISVPPGLRVRADERRLRQVLLNIGSNAIKYNRPGGTVHWRAEALPGAVVRMQVQDTGAGIGKDALPQLFLPFERLGKERTPIPGTGLGLVIARTLTEAMGGRLELDSEVGVGTTVRLDLPADEPRVEPAVPTSLSGP